LADFEDWCDPNQEPLESWRDLIQPARRTGRGRSAHRPPTPTRRSR